ncbi:protease modulator HflC [Thioalkalivibrio paradoxus]|uniref:Protein HflC n=1 Tax=Thioalkalivibrio paradoxus ARh 1 TaxID=713585 RepID=W0DFQ4_9GAMM|nr:protease modulator HflC [Thioalkalivibrio paradoxus]AHE97484.1 membane protease HflC [Thioalkalivibrio paradoxus ARh 1]
MFRIAAIAAVVAVIVVALSTYTVDERERVILFSLGEVRKLDLEPGLHFKFPLINNVRTFEKRIMTLNIPPDRFLTSEAKNVIVDFYAKWQIQDTGQFYRATRGDERNAEERLAQILRDGMRNEFARYELAEVVSGERTTIMGAVRDVARGTARELGVNLVDVRIRRIDLPDEVSESVYDRMRAERQRVAQDFRARGQEEAERIRSRADRDRTVILANAYRESEEIRGAGDARATEILGGAFGADEDFFRFYRSLLAYRSSLTGDRNTFVLEPSSEFFRYFQDPLGSRDRAPLQP